MGTFINLLVDDIEIDSSKNHIGVHHGKLFQKPDFYPDKTIEIPRAAITRTFGMTAGQYRTDIET